LVMNYLGSTGTFQFSFLDMETLSPGMTVYLKDNFLNQLTALDENSTVQFTVNGSESASADRFELVINPSPFTSVKGNLAGMGVQIYPNPSQSGKSATIAIHGFGNDQVNLSITDALGRVVITRSIDVKAGEVTEYSLSQILPSGMYNVKTSGSAKSVIRKFVVN